jgi:hypothetical protein
MDAERKSSEGPQSPGNGKSRFADWDDERPENPAAAAARSVPLFLAELKAYATYYLSAKVDGYKATAKKIAGLIVLGVVGLLIGAGILFAAAFLLLGGIAHALGTLFGGRMWLGEIIVGLLVLGGVGLTTWIMLKKFTEGSRKQTEQKYEGKRIQQRVELGRDVHERAK